MALRHLIKRNQRENDRKIFAIFFSIMHSVLATTYLISLAGKTIYDRKKN